MAAKKQTPAPIDRPLSRAYLREFTGWSTAYPPGVSEPTSLRLMENVQIQRDGSCRVRPGLTYVNYSVEPDDDLDIVGQACDQGNPLVGTHESFYNEYGRAYLYAVREDDLTVGFRVYASTDDGGFEIQTLTEAGFEILQGEAEINFTEDVEYVKYIQIDNKIFALATEAGAGVREGESMRQFNVGEDKSVVRPDSIDRPEWSVDDKLTVVHPDYDWINNNEPIDTRTNMVLNPTFGKSMDRWAAGNKFTAMKRISSVSHTGGFSLRVTSKPTRTNLIKQPLHDVATTDTVGWTEPGEIASVSIDPVDSTYARIRVLRPERDGPGMSYSTECKVQPRTKYKVGLSVGDNLNIDKIVLFANYYDTNHHRIGAEDRVIDNDVNVATGRRTSGVFTTPGGCFYMKLGIGGKRHDNTLSWFQVKDIYLGPNTDGSTAALDGSDGTDYYWTGTTNASSSVYHPAKDIKVMTGKLPASTDVNYYGSAYVRGAEARDAKINLAFFDDTGALAGDSSGTAVPSTVGSWQRISYDDIFNSDEIRTIRLAVIFEDVGRGDTQYVDSVLLERSGSLKAYFSGDTSSTSTHRYKWLGKANDSKSRFEEYTLPLDNPTEEPHAAGTLISSTDADNEYSFGFFYTFENEIGETAPSQVTVVKAQRDWAAWVWKKPGGTATNNPDLSRDQLAAFMPEDVFRYAVNNGATGWNLYMLHWSDQQPYPDHAMLVDHRDLVKDHVYGEDSWGRVTPAQPDITAATVPVPTENARINSTYPSRGANGLVAADRMVLVLDPNEAAVIRWSSNQQGDYTNFSPLLGGGFKTLTSGNLMLPACVKLWQNPQSTDTLTILCLGTDGHSTGYYMAPAQVASQSEAVNIMGFEETTATPGTTSPFGCEVLNNALYHPLDEHLVKSVASNYNINHSFMSDLISDVWTKLEAKDHIVSCQHDNRLYYLVFNPGGDPLEDGCWGNEVWVLDVAQKTGTWSRWKVQGQSLRKIRRGGQVVMSLIHPTGIFFFDPQSSVDNYVDDAGLVQTRNIPWLLETNTQGANRAHDAWANLQQANLQVGFFQGKLRYGVRGLDVNGKTVDISKEITDTNAPGIESWDLEDFLLIRRLMKEWFFYASSVTDDDDVVEHSAGQLSLVQYRYTPVSVNVGYEYGSVETFEYGRAGNAEADRNTVNGVPMTYVDTGRP